MSASRAYITSLKNSLSVSLERRGHSTRECELSWLIMFDLVKRADVASITREKTLALLHDQVLPPTSTAGHIATAAEWQLALARVEEFLKSTQVTEPEILLQGYVLALKSKGCSTSTIKNYLSDIRQILAFASGGTLVSTFTETRLLEFSRGQERVGLAGNTIRRKLTTAAQFGKWLAEQDVIDPKVADKLSNLAISYGQTGSLKNEASLTSLPQIPDAIVHTPLPEATSGELRVDPNQAHNQVLEPRPITAQDSRKTKNDHQSYGTQADTIPAHRADTYLRKEDLDKNEELQAVISSAVETRLRTQSPKKKKVLTLQTALTSLALILSVTGFGLFAKSQFLDNPETPFAYPNALTRPNRTLSFQGRLTDTAQNPVTVPTDMAFRLYDTGPGTGGSELWNSSTCSVTPDQDGIFSVGLGDECGAEISGDVFSENNAVWLEVEIESETLEPRQSIKAVAYALNAETLQGYPATASAVESTVVVMNEYGQIVLGNASPVIRATAASGLTLDGLTLNLTTTAGSNGNVVIDPDGLGQTLIQSNLGVSGAATVSGNITTQSNLSAAGNLAVSGNAAVGGSAAISGYATVSSSLAVGYNNAYAGSGNGIFSGRVGVGTSSPSDTLHIAGSLRLTGAFKDASNSVGSSGYILSSTGAGTSWIDPVAMVEGTNYWNLVGGAVFTKNSTVDLLLGGSATTSADFAFMNVNSGTPTASISGNLAIASPTGANPASTYTILNGGSFNLRTSVGGDTGATSRLLVTNNGNVGINTTSPGAKLAIDQGAVTNQPSLLITNIGAGTSGITIDHTGSPIARLLGTSGGRYTSSYTNGGGLEESVLGNGGGFADGAFRFTTDANAAGAFSSAVRIRAGATQTLLSLQPSSGVDVANIGYDGGAYFAGNVGIGSTSPGANLDVTGTGRFSSTLTASNGLTLTTGALNLTATSGALSLSGMSASSMSFGANNLLVTSGNFTTTSTGINSTAIGATTPSTGAFTTLSSTGATTLGNNSSTVAINSNTWDITTAGVASGLTGITSSGTISFTGLTGDTDDTVLILNASNQVRTREIDTRVWGSSLLDGSGVTSRVAYWSDANTVTYDDDFVFDGVNVGIGTTAISTYRLNVNGNVNLTSGFDYHINGVGLNDNTSAASGASLIGLYDDSMTYIGGNTTVQSAIKQLDTNMGTLAAGSSKWTRVAGNLYPTLGESIAATTSGGTVGTFTATGSNLALRAGNAGAGVFSVSNVGGISVAGASTFSNTITATGLGTGTDNTVLILNGSNQITTDEIDARVWGTSLVDSTTGAANYVARFTDADTLGIGTLYDNATNVGVGSTSPGAKLDVVGSIRSSALTSGRVTFATTGGELTDSANLTWNGNQLDISGSSNPGFRVYNPSPGSNGWYFYNGAGGAGNFGMYDITAGKDRLVIKSDGTIDLGNEFNNPFVRITATGNVGIASTSPGATLDVTGTGRFSSTLTASNGLTQTTGALNLTATSGMISLSGMSASSMSFGANNLLITAGNFNTTSTGINSTAIGATTPSTGAFTTLSSTGATTLGNNSSTVAINSNTWDVSTAGVASGLTGITSSGTISFTGLTGDTDDTVLILNSSNQVRTREIDTRVWGSTLVDGSGTTSYLARWTDANTLGIGATYDDGTNVGIGTTTVSAYRLNVNGNVNVLSGFDYHINGVGLNDNTSGASGASLIGLYDDSMTYIGGNTTVQGAIKELDTNMGTLAAGTSKWSRVAGNLYPTLGESLSATTSGGTVGTFTATGTNTALLAGSASNYFTVSNVGAISVPGTAVITGTLTANGSLVANNTFTLGDGGDTGSVNTSDWDISTTGVMTGISGITTDGGYTQSGSGANAFTGATTITNALTSSGGAVSLNHNSNFTVNIGTGTTTSTVSIGGGANQIAINSSSWDITGAGVASGLTGLSSTGTITFGGLTANRLVTTDGSSNLATTISSANVGASITDETGTGLVVFNNAPTFSTGSVTFSGITNDIVTPGNEHFAIVPGGTGNVGINSTTPGAKLDVTGTGRFSQTLTASNGLTQTTGALNLTATSGTLSLTGMSASSMSFGANNLTVTAGNFNTTSTGINSTAIGATTPSTGAFTTLSSTGATTLGNNSSTVAINSNTWDVSTAGVASGLTGITSSGTISFTGLTGDTDDTVLILNSSNQVRTREIDTRVWGSSLVDGSGTANRVAYFTGTSTIASDDDLFFNGTNVGIGTTTVTSYRLNVNGNVNLLSGFDYHIDGVGLNDNTSAASGASLIGLYDDSMTYIAANTTVQSAIKQLDTNIGILAGGTSKWSRVAGNLYPTLGESISATTSGGTVATFTATGSNLALRAGNAGAGFFSVSNIGSISTPTGATITFAGLTANRLVSTDGSSQLTTTISSANVGASISDETGTGLVVFNNGPTLTTSSVTFSGITSDIVTPGNEHFAIVPGGTGNVGINSTTPGAKLDVTGTGRFSSTLTASNGLTLTTGALNLTATSGTIALTGMSASSMSFGANNLIITAGNFNTTSTGINSTAIGATTPSTGAFTTLSSTGVTALGNNSATVAIDSSTWDISTAGVASGLTGITSSGTISFTGLTGDTDDTVVILNSSNQVRTREIDTRVWGTSLVDGTGTANRVAYFTGASTIASDDDLYFNGTNVGIGTTTVSTYRLNVNGNVNVLSGFDYHVDGVGLNDNSSGASGASLIGLFDDSMDYVASNTTVQSAIKQLDTNMGILAGGASKWTRTSGNLYPTLGESISATTSGGTVGTFTATGTNLALRAGNAGAGFFSVTNTGSISTPGTVTFSGLTANRLVSTDGSSNLATTISSANVGASITDETGTGLVVFNNAPTFSTGSVTFSGITSDIVTPGSEHFAIVPGGTGNVGINSTTPGAKLDVTGTGRFSQTLTASNGFTQTTGALNLTATSGTIALTGMSASSMNFGANNLTITAGNFNTTSTGINGTAIGATTPSTGAFTTLAANNTVTLTGLTGDTDDTVLILNSSNQVRTREIDARVWGSSLVDGSGTGNRVAYWSDPNTVAADDDFFFDGTNVGIGTTTTPQRLTVAGNIQFSGALMPAGNAGTNGYMLQSTGAGTAPIWVAQSTLNYWQRNAGAVAPLEITNDLLVGGAATASARVRLPGTNNQHAWFNLGTGNVGINTTTPAAKLDVLGEIRSTRSEGTVGVNVYNPDTPPDQSRLNSPFVRFTGVIDNHPSVATVVREEHVADLVFVPGITGSAEQLQLLFDGTHHFTFSGDGTGRLGIGTNDPVQALHVVGSGYISTNLGIGTTSVAERLNVDGSGTFTGNVAIGTTTNSNRLAIVDTNNTVASVSLTNNTATTIGAGGNVLGVMDLQSTSLTTGNFMNIEVNALTTGTALNISRSGAGLTTGGELVNLDMGAATAGNGAVITTTGVYTGTGLLTLTANSATTGTLAAISANGLTSGTGLAITRSGAGLTTNGELLDLNMGAATAGNGVTIVTTGNYTGTGLITATANSATSGTLTAISGTALTTGRAVSITAGGTTALTTGGAILVTGPTGAAALSGAAGGVVNFTAAGAYTSTNNAGLLNLNAGTATGVVQAITANSLTTGTALLIPHTTSVIANGGSLARITSSSVDTSTTTGVLLDLQSTGSAAGTQFLQTYSALNSGIGQSIVTNALNTGTAFSLSSSSTALTTGGLISAVLSGNPAASWTGALARFEITGNDADIDGDALRVGVTTSSTAGSVATALNVTSAGPSGSYVARFNDNGAYTDSSPVIIDHDGNLGIGVTNTNSNKLYVSGGNATIVNAATDVSMTIHASTASSRANLTLISLNGSSVQREWRIMNNLGNSLQFYNATDAVTAMTMLPNGNVGIGTTNPSRLLHVQGDMRLTGAFYDGSNSAGSSNYILRSTGSATEWIDPTTLGMISKWQINAGTVSPHSSTLDVLVGANATSSAQAKFASVAAGENFFMGNLGIGTNNPAQALHVAGNLQFSQALMPNGSAGTAGYMLQSQGAGTAPIWVDPSVIAGTNFWQVNSAAMSPINNTWDILLGNQATASANIRLSATSGQHNWINNGGNFGLGTTNPAEAFELLRNQNTGTVARISNSNTGTLAVSAFQVASNTERGGFAATGSNYVLSHLANRIFVTSELGNGVAFAANAGSGMIQMYTGGVATGNERFRIASNGNMGLGTTTTSNALINLPANTAADGGFNIGADVSLYRSAANTLRIGDSDYLVMANGTTGNIAVGTTTTSNGRIYAQTSTSAGTALYGMVSSTGANTRAIYGLATGGSGTTYGVWGQTGSTSGIGVYGVANTGTGTTYGVYGQSGSTSGTGVYGVANAGSGTTYGVYGSATSSSGYAIYGSGRGYFSDNLGIGSLSPTQALDVVGNVRFSQALMPNGSAGTSGYLLTSAGAGTAPTWTDPATIVNMYSQWQLNAGALAPNNITNDLLVGSNATASAYARIAGTANQHSWINNGSGNFGIGTNNPSSFKLEVAGSIGPSADDTYDLGSNTRRWRDLFLGPDSLHIGTSTTDEGLISYNTSSNIFAFGTDSTSNGDIAFFTDDLYLDKSSGNVGVGVTNPSERLHVEGGNLYINNSGTGRISFTPDASYIEATADSFIFKPGVGGNDYFDFRDDSSNSLFMLNNIGRAIFTHNVGLGVEPFNFKLEVAGNAGPSVDATFDLGSPSLRWRNLFISGMSTGGMTVSSLFSSIVSAQFGHNGYTNFSGGVGTGNVDSITSAQRLTSQGNLVNIGSYQGGGMSLTRGGTLAAKVDYLTGDSPDGIAIGELNGTGSADLVVANVNDDDISVYVNNGNGTFAPKVDYAVGVDPLNVAVMDLNGDGKPDLAVSNSGDDDISVLMNNGNGTFAAKVDYPAGNQPYGIAAGDLNGDGSADIVTVNSLTDNDISVFMNDGAGTFAAKVDYPTATAPRYVSIADFNGDSKADLAVTNSSSNSVSVFINNGNGTFATKVDYTTGTAPLGVAAGDVDGDGDADIVTANSSGTSASVFINTGNGTFAAKADYTTATTPITIALGDVNGDGKPDMVTANSASDSLSVFINNGNGTFAAKADSTTGDVPRGVVLGDLNGDGKMDTAVTNFNDDDISILLNQPSPIFVASAATGNVGIGTTDVSTIYTGYDNQNNRALEIAGSATSDNTQYSSLILSKPQSGTSHLVGSLFFANTAASGAEKRLAQIHGMTDGATNSGALGFGTSNAGTYATRMTLNREGNLGIGTTGPNALLDLANTVQLSDRMLFSGQEFYQASNTSTSGVAVRLGVNRTNNRQLWFADSSQAINATNPAFRILLGQTNYASIGGVSTDGSTELPLAINSAGVGNVAIGTTLPVAKLQSSGAAATATPTLGSAVGGGFLVTNPDENYGTLMGVASTGRGWIQQQRVDGTGTAYDLLLQPSGGAVGIGTSATGTSVDLDVHGFIGANANDTIGSNPPTVGSNLGWKIGLWGNTYAMGVAGNTAAIKTGNWVSFFSGANPSGGSNATTDPDDTAYASFAPGASYIRTNLYIAGTTSADPATALRLHHTGTSSYVDYNTGDLNFRPGGSGSALFLGSNGNVGIGTTLPAQKLHVVHSGTAANRDAIRGDVILTGAGSTVTGVGVHGEADWTGTSGTLTGLYGGLFRLDVTGGTGGTITHGRAMQLEASINAAKTVTNMYMLNIVNPSGGTLTNLRAINIENLTNGTNNWAIYQNGTDDKNYLGGNTGIGITPTQKLEVNGRIRMNTWTADGDAVAYRDTTTNSIALIASDQRLKKDIVPLTGALDVISQIGAYKYHELNETSTDKLRVGLMAQEFLTLMPELTFSFTKEGSPETYYSVHYDKVAVLAIRAIQEQQHQIVNLQSSLSNTDLTLNSIGSVSIGSSGSGYAVTPVGGGPALTKIIGVAEGVIGKMYAGLITTKDLVVSGSSQMASLVVNGSGQIASLSVNNLSVAGQSLQAYIEGVVNNMQLAGTTALPEGTLVVEDFVATGSAELSDVTADSLVLNNNASISGNLTVASNASIAGILNTETVQTQSLQANSTLLGSLLVENDASVLGDASVSGNLDVLGSARLAVLESKLADIEHISAVTASLYSATISGTLYADKIADLDRHISESVQPTFLQQLLGYDPESTHSAEIIASITGVNLEDTIVLDPAALDGLTVDSTLLGAHAGFFNQYLQVNGNAAFGGDVLMVGATTWASGLTIADNSISYVPQSVDQCSPEYVDPAWSELDEEELAIVMAEHQTMCREHVTLKIQPTGSGVLDLMNGLLVAENGSITIDGAVTFKKPVTVESTLLTDLVSPTDFDRPFQLQVAGVATESGEVKKSRFELIDELGTPVATISAEGVGQFSKVKARDGLAIGNEGEVAPDNGTVSVNASAGRSMIPSGQSQITIQSEQITNDSLLNLTLLSDSNNQVLYIKDQGDGYAIVGFKNVVAVDTRFNWWIIE